MAKSAKSIVPSGDTDDQFIDELAIAKQGCLLCGKVVKNPVDTICGHRFCETCCVSMLPNDGTSIKCPGGGANCTQLSKLVPTVGFSKSFFLNCISCYLYQYLHICVL